MTRKSERILNVAIVGGGPGCLAIMDMISMDLFQQLRVKLVGIADINPDAPALKRAQSSGIHTAKDYHDLFNIPNLDLIIELTGSMEVSKAIQCEKPAHVQMIDHTVTRMFWDFFRLEDNRLKAEEEAEERLEKEVKERSLKLKASKEETRLEKRTAEGIIYGSPTPMFVVDKNHKVIYWNRACEKLTGFRSEEMIGTDRHWAPFYSRKRPLLADVIIDDDTEKLKKATKKMNLRKSPIVEGGYEAEVFVPHLGEEGTHLYFNTAPIKDDAGNIRGAIVTYLDFSERVRMTGELQASEEETQLQKRTAEGIIYGSPTPMFVVDKNHKVIYWNRACEKLTGFRSEEMIGTDRHWAPFYSRKRPLLADVIIDNDTDKLKKVTKKMNLRKSPIVEGGYEAEVFVPHLGEEGTHLYFNTAPIKDDAGNVRGAIVTYLDFSERVRMTRELKASEEETRLQKRTAEGIIYGSPIPMFVLDKDHKITHWNKAVEKLTGFRSEDMIGTERQWEPFFPNQRPILADLIIDNDQEKIEKFYGHMNLSKSTIVEGAYEAEHFFPHLGKEGTHLYFNAAPIKDDSGNIRGAIVTYQDFSEREKMLLEIKRRETFVQNLIHDSIDGIIATEAKGIIVIFNRGAVEILGYRPEEIIGRMTYTEILSVETGLAVRDAFYGNEYGPPGKIVNMEGKLLNKASEEIPVRLSGTLIYEQEQEVGSVVFIQDLREIHRLQEEKEQAQRMAAIGRTVAGVAHYIKNILTGLQGGSYVINSAMSRKDLVLVEKGWNMVERNIDQIAHIVTDMLIYSTERKPDYRLVDPNELIKEILELVEERAMTSGVTLVRELQPGLRMVHMDKTGIHRSLLNLVSNAIDACTLEGIINGKGVVTVKTDSPVGWGVRFSVADNGTGMDEETKERLFTDFFTTKGYKGTGLGLPVTKKIIEEHGGRLTFESRAGHGTTFTLMLLP